MTSEPESPLDEAAPEGSESPEAEAPPGADPESTGAIDRGVSNVLTHWRPVLVTVSVVASVGLAASLFFAQYLPDRKIDQAAARQVIAAASDGAVAALSYSSDTMDQDFGKARSHLTGDFLAYYDKFTKDFVVPVVRQKHLTQTAAVVRAAISELKPNSAVVIVFINETTVSKDKPQPLMTPSGVRITLTKVGGSWLISTLDPVV